MAKSKVSIHAPHAGGDMRETGTCKRQIVSIHAPHAGGDVHLEAEWIEYVEFQSTPPTRGATREVLLEVHAKAGFNPRPPRGGRHTLERVQVD